MTVSWVQDDINGPFRRVVDDVTVATVGDRTYEVPAEFDFNGFGLRTERGGHVMVSGTMRIVDGRARFGRVLVEMDGTLSPKEVQTLPWGQIAESAVAVEAASGGQGGRHEVLTAREKSRAAQAARERRRREKGPETRQYRKGRSDLYRQVLELRAEAERIGVPYGDHVSKVLGYKPAYVRRLHQQAKRWQAESGSEIL